MLEAHSGQRIVALTGATGFIGQHLTRALLEAGFTVRAIVRNLSKTKHDVDPRCEVAEVDLANATSMGAALENVQTVVYAAGSVRGRDFEDFQLANVQGVKVTSAALSRQHRETPMLLLSSLAASAPELSFYAQSKAAGERELRSSNLSQWSIFRPPAVYGPGDTEMRPIFNAIRRGLVPLIASPEQRLPFIEISDLVQAILAWVSHPAACAGKTFAIDDGTTHGYDWRRIQELIAPTRALRIRVPKPLLESLGHLNLTVSKLTGHAPMLTPGKVRELRYLHWACDNNEFTAATGWQPKLGLAEGVERLFAR